jgi:hypothetical protein
VGGASARIGERGKWDRHNAPLFAPTASSVALRRLFIFIDYIFYISTISNNPVTDTAEAVPSNQHSALLEERQIHPVRDMI